MNSNYCVPLERRKGIVISVNNFNMKYQVLILYFLIPILSFGQSNRLQEGEVDFQHVHLGKKYVSVRFPEGWEKRENIQIDSSRHEGYFIYFLPPKFNTIEKVHKEKIDPRLFIYKAYKKDTIVYYDIGYEYAESYLFPEIYPYAIDRNCASADLTYSLALEFNTIPAKIKYKTIRLSENQISGKEDTITFTHTYSLVKEPAKVMVSKQFKSEWTEGMSFTKVVFLKGKNWSKFREILCTGIPAYPPISTLQIRLIKLGYDIPVTNMVDVATRRALVDFQKKNKLPVGSLNFETLRRLDMIPEKRTNYYEYLEEK